MYKSKIINSKVYIPKKYSNLQLFSRREKEVLNKKKSNSNKLLPLKINNESKTITKNDSLTKFALETISSFKFSFDFLTTTQNETLSSINSPKPIIKDIKKKSIFPYHPSLTDINRHKKKDKTKKNIANQNELSQQINEIINDNKSENNNIFNTITNSNSNINILHIKEEDNKIDILKKLVKERNEEKINKKLLSTLNCKQKKFEIKKNSAKDMLNKTRHLMYFKFTNDIKKENNMRLQESYQNKLEFVEDNIKTLNRGKTLYDVKFSNKLSEYVKYIYYYKDEEKKKCDLLLNDINIYKKEITKLQNKIIKEQFERDNILKWIYFQIKMKEKKLILPKYYKKIIETSIKRFDARRKTIVIQMADLKMIRDSQTVHHSVNKQKTSSGAKRSSTSIGIVNYKLASLHNIHNNNNHLNNDHHSKNHHNNNYQNDNHHNYIYCNTALNLNKYKPYRNNLLIKPKNSLSLNQNHVINFEENVLSTKNIQKIQKNLNDESIDADEINRISQYKLYLIYNTPDDFYERLHELENENIQLLKEYNVKQRQLNQLKKEHYFTYKDRMENNNGNINLIKERELELQSIISRHELLKNQLSDIKKGKYLNKYNTNSNNNININKFGSKLKLKKNNKSNSPSLSKEVLLKIENLYNKCKINEPKKKEKNKKKNNNIKEEIIFMLTYIESCIDRLMTQFKSYNTIDYSNYELMKKLKNDIERKHKIENADMARIKEKENFIKFQQEIENKSHKIIFIQRRKVYCDYGLKYFGNNKKYKSDNDNQGQPTFEDFMFDKNEIYNFENKI